MNRVLREKRRAAPLLDGQRYRLTVEARSTRLRTWLDGEHIDETVDATFGSGRVLHAQGEVAVV